jgi:hypothetical protein
MRWGAIRPAAPAWPALLTALVALVALPGTVDQVGMVMAAALVALALMSLTLRHARAAAPLFTASSSGPASDTRCLRGSFRRQSSPDTPGRPRPRAPGAK